MVFGIVCIWFCTYVGGYEWTKNENSLLNQKHKPFNFLRGLIHKRSLQPANAVFSWHVFVPVLQCSGVLLNRRFVLTAASCLSRAPPSLPPSAILVRIGNHHINVEAPGEDTVPVLYVLPYPAFDEKTLQGNIAVLYLARDVMRAGFSQVSPAQLLNLPRERGSVSEQRVEAKVMGWGHHSRPKAPLPTLHQDSVFISSPQFCNMSYNRQVNEDMICVYGKNGSLCSVDDGSPMIAQGKDNLWILLGVFAWGNTCGLFPKPVVFTKIDSEMISWLQVLFGVKGESVTSCYF